MKTKISLLTLMAISSLMMNAQTIMNIHQSNGIVLQIPINTIDSITYTIPNPGNLATLTTTAANSIAETTAVSGGNITNDGGSLITQRGVCYSTNPSPTTANTIIISGSGIGSFTSNLTGLTATTTYYVRAYATNSAGTAYGNEVSFTTSAGGGGGTYPTGSVFCASGPTAIVDVTNPTTGAIWMDRNLGATQAATSSTDVDSYGDLYQWGRFSDGHQCRTSTTTSILSSTDQPALGDFIISPNSPGDWRSPQNDNLWQGVNGVNNPCPSGYRIPTEAELDVERLSWFYINATGAFDSPLKLNRAGSRYVYGSLSIVGSFGQYWSSTVSGFTNDDTSRYLYFDGTSAHVSGGSRANGMSVRCLKD